MSASLFAVCLIEQKCHLFSCNRKTAKAFGGWFPRLFVLSSERSVIFSRWLNDIWRIFLMCSCPCELDPASTTVDVFVFRVEGSSSCAGLRRAREGSCALAPPPRKIQRKIQRRISRVEVWVCLVLFDVLIQSCRSCFVLTFPGAFEIRRDLRRTKPLFCTVLPEVKRWGLSP